MARKKSAAVDEAAEIAETVITVEVTRKFIDKHTGVLHKVGDVLEINDARLAELTAAGDFVRVKE